MGYGIGSLLPVVVTLFARSVGLDRDRAFYPTMLIVVAHYYELFAVMGGSTEALIIESIVMTAFLTKRFLLASASSEGNNRDYCLRCS